MSSRAVRELTLHELLIVEDDSAILDFRCNQTGILFWPLVRLVFLRMMLSDLVYGVKLTGKTSTTVHGFHAVSTLLRSLTHNAQIRVTGRNRANVCVMSDGVANLWNGKHWFNRLTDHFVSAIPSDTLLIEDHFEWRWPFPRCHDRVMLHAPLQAFNTIEGRIRVRQHHRQRAHQLVSILTRRAESYLQWSPGAERFAFLVEMLARKTASLPSQYTNYLALLSNIQPRLLLVGGACYGPSASLIVAAKSLGIVTAEYQHGAVSGGHDAYNFATVIRDSQDYQRTLPDYFLGYGSWWNDQINAPVKKLAIGNPHRAAKIEEGKLQQSLKLDILILSDGIRFGRYLDLANKVYKAVKDKNFRIVLRPHPLERTKVSAQSTSISDGIIIDENAELYTSLRTAHVVISEVSTGLFEAVGVTNKIFIWNTSRSRFAFPALPFQNFDTSDSLIELLEQENAGYVDSAIADSIWSSNWRDNYLNFYNKLSFY